MCKLALSLCTVMCAVAGSLFATPEWDYRVESLTIPKGSYFDTGLHPGTHPYAWVRFTTVQGVVPFGTLTKTDGAFMLIYNSGDKKLYYRYGASSSEGATAAYDENQVLSVACYEQMLVNGAKKTAAPKVRTFTTTETITVPGRVQSIADTTFYGFRLWDGSTLTCELIPCVKDGTPCFYESVSGKFLSVNGGGTVTAGAQVDNDGRAIWDEADTVTINIASGTTTDLADWMEANSIESITGSKLIVKKGAGTLKVSTTSLSGFTGDVHLDEGRVVTSVANPFGPSDSGRVYVKSGATLETTWAVADTPVAFGSKPVYIAGTGTDGAGAIYVRPLAGNKQSGHPSAVYLTDDATSGGSTQTHVGGRVYLEGHTYTADYPSGWCYLEQSYYDTTGRGNLTMAKEILWQGDKANPTFNFGTSLNAIRYSKDANFRTYHYLQDPNYPWRLIMDTGSGFYCNSSTSIWYGEVRLEAGGHRLLRQDSLWAWQKYYGKVTGPGGFGKSNNNNGPCIGLYNANNDFAGGVYLWYNNLEIGCNGALPAAGAALTNYNSTVRFASQTAEYDLPEAYFCQTGQVCCTTAGGTVRGAWRKRVTKAGTGMLLYDTLLGSSNLVVKGGSVKFPVTDADAELPVFTNVQVCAGASVTFGDGYEGAWSVPCLVSGGGTIAGAVSAAGFAVDAATAGETLTVSGVLTFVTGSQVEVPTSLPRTTVREYTLVTSPSITGLPHATDARWHAHTLANGDGTVSLKLVYGVGSKLIVR